MKIINLVVSLLLVSFATSAQEIFINPEINRNQYKQHLFLKRFFKDSFMLPEKKFTDQGITFLYSTAKGKVYQLPLDKSRCFVPDFHSNMPVSRKMPAGYIPNSKKNKTLPAT